MQTKRQSMIETASNTGIGFIGSFIIVWLCVKYIRNPELASFVSVSACTVWSLVRGYYVRRYFNTLKGKSQ